VLWHFAVVLDHGEACSIGEQPWGPNGVRERGDNCGELQRQRGTWHGVQLVEQHDEHRFGSEREREDCVIHCREQRDITRGGDDHSHASRQRVLRPFSVVYHHREPHSDCQRPFRPVFVRRGFEHGGHVRGGGTWDNFQVDEQHPLDRSGWIECGEYPCIHGS